MRERLDAKYILKKEFFEAQQPTKYIYSNVPEVISSVDNSRKRIIYIYTMETLSPCQRPMIVIYQMVVSIIAIIHTHSIRLTAVAAKSLYNICIYIYICI